ncbi:MAG TPA: DUF4157 domain-containing protein [Kofleriaceae bacterium]|nr:DUF4157 domain-containing protein [Kofleriaceae bacterium]
MSDLGHAAPSTNDAAQTHGSSKADGGGTIGAGNAIDAVAAEPGSTSSGRGLDVGIKTKMERAFGADFSGVKVHTDGAANQAAQNINAKAFAQGSDIFFDQGKYDPDSESGEKLIAHELAHVVQTGGGGQTAQPKAHDGAASVSSPGDSAETAADAAADKAVRGESVGSVGTAPATTLHRDALGDLESAASGNWLGSVDGAKVLAKVRALPAADKAALKTGNKYDALNRRIMKKLDTGECLEYLNTLGGLDLRWKLFWLNEGSQLDELSAPQWQWLVGYASPQTMDLLRAYPHGYKAFLKNAPLEMIPPWDRLQGLEDGTWKGTATDIRNAIANLNAEQKAQVRADTNKVTKIMRSCGDASERFRVVTYLEFKVKWAVFYLDSVQQLPSLSQQQWSQLLSECTRADYDELVGWAAMWALVQKHCPPAIVQITRQNSDPAAAAKAFEDPVQVEAMFTTLGPAGFLASATRDPLMTDHIYTKAKAKVIPTVDGLPSGLQMGTAAKANLREWFFTASSTDAECQKMFERRFRVQTTGLGTYNHTHDNGVKNSTTLNPFTKVGLTSMWQVCETLPPAAVEGNPHLMNILRDSNRGTGSAYYAGPEQRAKGDVLMGYGTDAAVQNNKVGSSNDNIYQDGTGAPNANIRQFNATLRHEIGHAVDSQLGIMKSWMAQEVAGGWIEYSSYTAFVDAIIAAAGGMNYGSADINKKYRKGMIDAVSASPAITFSAALTANGVTPPATDPGGAVSVVWEPLRYGPAGSPWYNQARWRTVGGRNFVDSYGSSQSLYSFIAAQRTARKVTDYQWRAPAEWFAECYQVYYSETENAAPGAAVGARLRSKDPEAAQMLSQVVDRGFSPQQMSDGTVAKTPGT